MNEKFLELRKRYPTFIYHDYHVKENENQIILQFDFEIVGLCEFHPKIEIKKKEIPFREIDNDFVRNLVFHIGMVELVSYWKCTCSPNVLVKCGYLNEEQMKWFQKLYYNGLGEYRYINQIDISQEEMMKITVEAPYKELKDIEIGELKGTLIPIGGGKDSTVTLELLKQNKNDNYCLMIGGKEPSLQSAKIAGHNDNQIIEVTRTIDSELLGLNKKGYLNGHTPFSSLLAFLSYFIAFLTNKKYVALSNESSAEESNVEGEKINHQYSKSYEFEQDFADYSSQYLKAGVHYFSLLRPLNELQIAKLFSQNPKYHSIFRSCNVGSKSIPWEWCGECPKCLFVFIILSPFLYKEELIKIFGKDLFQKGNLLETFKELCGQGKTKPFECVGTYEEVNYALTTTIQKLEKQEKEIPYLLKFYKENDYMVDITQDITKRYNEKNNVPKELNDMLKEKLNIK